MPRFAVSALSGLTFCDSISPSMEWGQFLSTAGSSEKEADLLFWRAEFGNGSEPGSDVGRRVRV